MRSLSGPQVAVATQQPIDPLATCRLDPVAAAVLEGVLQYRKAGFPLLCGGWVVLRVWTKAFSMQGKHCAIDCISSSLKYVGFFNFFFNNSWLPFHPRQQCILFALLRKHSCSLSLSGSQFFLAQLFLSSQSPVLWTFSSRYFFQTLLTFTKLCVLFLFTP